LIRSVRGFTPSFGSDCFLAETAVVIGEVQMGSNCSSGIMLLSEVM